MPKPFDPYHVWLGIPPGARPPTHYQLLGISPDEDDREVIQAAVLRLSAYVRNFQVGKYAADSTRILNELAEAKLCLLDPTSRARYDASRSPPTVPPRPAPAPRLERPVVAAAPLPMIEFDARPVAPARYAAPRPVVTRRLPTARRTQTTSPLVWLLPLAMIAVASAAAIGFALRPAPPPESSTMLAGQVVPHAPDVNSPPVPAVQATNATRADVGAPSSVVPSQPIVVEKPPENDLARSESSLSRPPTDRAPFSPPPSSPPRSSPPPFSSSRFRRRPGATPSPFPPMPGVQSQPPAMSEPAPLSPSSPPAVFVPSDERRPVPTGASLTAARSKVDSVFAKAFKAAKTADDRLEAIRELYYESQAADEPALRYAFLEETRNRAINLGEAGQACQAIEEMGRLFQIDVWPEKVKALKLALDKAKKSPQAFTVAMLGRALRHRTATTDPSFAGQFEALAAAAERKTVSLGLTKAAAASARSMALGGRTTLRGRGGMSGQVGMAPRPGLAASLFQGSDFEQELFRRVDRDVDFRFGFDSVHPSLANDGFSIRWTGWLTPPMSGKYIITAIADDGVRVTIDGQKVIDSWQTTFTVGHHEKEVELLSRPLPMVVEYCDRRGTAAISLRWSIKDLSTEHTIPAEAFSHEPMIGE